MSTSSTQNERPAEPLDPLPPRMIGIMFVGVALALIAVGVGALDPSLCGWAMATAALGVFMLAHADDRQTGGHR